MTLPTMLGTIGEKHGEVARFRCWAIWTRLMNREGMGVALLRDDHANRLEELRARVAFKRRVAEMAEDGTVYLIVWQRDCDMAEWTERRAYDAHPEVVMDAIDAMYEQAEGPLTYRFVTKAEYDAFKRESRDRALEAFEDGHPHVIYA